MTDLPAPMTTPEIDVRDLDGFMLNTERLLASELWALATGEEFKAAMGLWCRAWKQIPAGSLPNDQRILASFAGVPAQRWAKLREVALRGFVLCTDGRLYHRVLCQDAVRAFGKKVSYRNRGRTGAAVRWGSESDSPANASAIADAIAGDSQGQGQVGDREAAAAAAPPPKGAPAASPDARNAPAPGPGGPAQRAAAAAPTANGERARLGVVLARFGMATSPKAIEEWRGMVAERAGITAWGDVELFLAGCAEFGRAAGKPIRYARDAMGRADEWRAARSSSAAVPT